MTALFAIPCIAAFIYTIWQYEVAHKALIASCPPELKEGFTERFVLSEMGLSPLTPLPIQATYMNSLWVGTFAMLCFSLTLFSIGEIFGGWLGLLFFFVGIFSTIKSWKTYKENCNRKLVRSDQEVL